MLIEFLANRAALNRSEAILIVREALKSGLSQIQMKNRVNIVLEKNNIKNIVGYLIFAMSDKFQTPKEVRAGFDNLSQRTYSKEWFQLYEKNLLYPERMTEAEKVRLKELTYLANEH